MEQKFVSEISFDNIVNFPVGTTDRMLCQLVTDGARNFRFLETKLIALADSSEFVSSTRNER